MAGHSKWANIQHRKNAQDAKKGKLFTQLIREITISAREAGADESVNPRLRLAIDKAMAANMSKDVIERAILRGSGQSDGDDLIEMHYEAYATGGIALIIDCLSDNRNRTVADIRFALGKHGAHMATVGSVDYLFSKVGIIEVADDAFSEDELLTIAIELDAQETYLSDSTWYLLFSPEHWPSLEKQIQQPMWQAFESCILQKQLGWHPHSQISVDHNAKEALLLLLLRLEELDDVQKIYHNAKIVD